VSITTDAPRPIGELLDAIETGDEAALIDDMIDDVIDRIDEALLAIAERFPGALRLGRYQVSGRALRAGQYGGLLDLVVRIGPPMAELLIAKMAAPDRDVRFYATVCTGELRPLSAVRALVDRLFDPDHAVRSCAVDALAGYPLRDLDEALIPVRTTVHAADADRVVAATTAIAALADVGAIPELIAALDVDSRHSEHARRTLIVLTRQDFGLSVRKWRHWWDDNCRRNRVEWLIDALNAKEADLRAAAIEALRRLTGEYFGYHHDLSKKEREAAVQRWYHWWLETGRRRFAKDAVPTDERERPTATINRE
jgi:HEAT repeat protein